MMKRVFILGGIFIGALVQLFLPSWPVLGGAKPPVLAALVLYYALRLSWRDMWIAVFWAALLHDGLDIGPFGPALLAFPVIGFLAHRIRSEVFADGVVTHLVCGMLGAMVVTATTLLVFSVSGQRPIPFGYALLHLVGSGLLGMATLPIVSFAMNMLEAALPKRRGYGWQ
jgi:rod shape-determining protein MreD